MGLLGGLISGAIGLATSAFGAITGAVSAVLGPFALPLITFLVTTKTGQKLIRNLLTSLGIIEKEDDEKLRERGERVLQAAERGVKRENFENFDDFEKALNGFELDEEKMEKRKKDEQVAAGLVYSCYELQEKKGLDVMDAIKLSQENSELLEKDDVSFNELVNELTEKGLIKIRDFYAGNLSTKKTEEMDEILKKYNAKV
ncbi:hypothetical protein [Fusobacterium polymorphum]|jgi:hypothetical protein|uniref:hypothetical protein n=1 Tax=Fusobacterium nucleatum subsp. polymorphum TaxID=76857 RepID=UPI0030CD23EF